MRRISMSLFSTSVIALAVAASPAAAQTSDPAAPVDPTVEAQEQPADPEAGSAETDDAVQTATGQDQATAADDTIVVTGLRRSLQSAQNIKRNSEQIVDAIVAEYIANADSSSPKRARIPGSRRPPRLRVRRFLVRGLPDFTTTYMAGDFYGRPRVVALRLPVFDIAALEVFQTSSRFGRGRPCRSGQRPLARPFDSRARNRRLRVGIAYQSAVQWYPISRARKHAWDTGIGGLPAGEHSRTGLDTSTPSRPYDFCRPSICRARLSLMPPNPAPTRVFPTFSGCFTVGNRCPSST